MQLVFLKTKRKTVQLIFLMRHGPQYPLMGNILEYLKDHNPDNIEEEREMDEHLHGKLNGNGYRMSYLLGKFLGDKYPNFIKNNIKSMDDFFSFSSSKERSQGALQAFTLGLFGVQFDKEKYSIPDDLSQPPFQNDKIPDDSQLETALPSGYYPFPGHSSSSQYNSLFLPFDSSICKRYKKLKAEVNINSMRYLESAIDTINNNEVMKKLLKEISKDKRSNPKSQWDIFLLSRYLRAMRNLDISFGIEDEQIESLQKSNAVLGSLYLFDSYGLDIMLYRLVNNITSHADQALQVLKGKEKNYKKLVVYSGNEINIWSFLQKFNLSSSDCLEEAFDNKNPRNCLGVPGYSSSFLFDLYTLNDGELYIGMFCVFLNKQSRDRLLYGIIYFRLY